MPAMLNFLQQLFLMQLKSMRKMQISFLLGYNSRQYLQDVYFSNTQLHSMHKLFNLFAMHYKLLSNRINRSVFMRCLPGRVFIMCFWKQLYKMFFNIFLELFFTLLTLSIKLL